MRQLVGYLVALLVLVMPAIARAQQHGAVSLVWNAPEACPSTYVHERIVHLLGSAVASPDDKLVSAIAEVKHTGSAWQLRLRTQREDTLGERSFRTSSCIELGHAAALVLALLVNPERVAAAAPTSPVREPPPEPEPKDQTVVSVPAPRPAKTGRVSATVSIEGLLDVGTLPRVGAGGLVAIGLALGRLRV